MLLPIASARTPQALLQQPAFEVRPNQPVDLVIPGDPPRDDSDFWFVKMNQPDRLDPLWMPDPRAGNEVMYLLGGEATYNAMADALESTYKPGPSGEQPKNPFIYLANWNINFDFNLRRKGRTSQPDTTLKHYLTTAAVGHGVMVRGIFWFRTHMLDADQNRVERTYINEKLSNNGHAFLDGRHNWFGSHHQKILLVNGSEGLVAFSGGVDFAYNRVFGLREKVPSPEGDVSNDDMKKTHLCTDAGAPLLDVHTRIRGPAAYDLLDLFLRRYADHVSAKDSKILAPHQDPRPRQPHKCYVRVCATFGDDPSEQNETYFVPSTSVTDALYGPSNAADPDLVTIDGKSRGYEKSNTPYSFAPKGRKSGLAQLLFAIQSARRFIYFEDQYMVSEEIAAALREASNHRVQVLGVIPHQSISTDYDFDHGPKAFNFDQDTGVVSTGQTLLHYDNLLGSVRLSRVIHVIHGENADPDKVNFLFCPVRDHSKSRPDRYQYIHSKVFVFDDAFCTIGSMNFNKRSTTHDSEVSLGYYEPGSYEELRFGFAHRMRMRLWARHLNFAENELHLLADPMAAIRDYWSKVQFETALTVNGRTVMPNVERYNWTGDVPFGDRAPAARKFVDDVCEPGDENALTNDLPTQDRVLFPPYIAPGELMLRL
jgi:phosphatidylserine/phosphatidylglycerophosphate/cardiolipin synthase-like enzyme